MHESNSPLNEGLANVYERVGGNPFFVELIERFYEFVESDLVLRPLYPKDLEPGKAHLASFLAQYWGGPPHYSLERGHPRLRQRHMPFSIGQKERDAWVMHMLSALDAMQVPLVEATLMKNYFQSTATSMMNS